MLRGRFFTLLACALVLSVPLHASAALLGVDLGSFVVPGGVSRLYDVNQATGTATNPRLTGTNLLVDIAFAPSGTLYGVTSQVAGGPVSSLYRLDPVTGAATLIGPTGVTILEGDLAFNPITGTLFGAVSQGTGLARNLFTVN